MITFISVWLWVLIVAPGLCYWTGGPAHYYRVVVLGLWYSLRILAGATLFFLTHAAVVGVAS